MTAGVHTIMAASAEDALCEGLEYVTAHGEREESRAGTVLVAPCPVVTVTSDPRRRVVRAPWRDANPFFHLVEAAWMLAGRDEVGDLLPYVKRFAEFAEDDGLVHGAYGRRWRSHFDLDQLEVVVNKLRREPLTRQCVIAMWDADTSNGDDLSGFWRDRPCNTHIYLRNRLLFPLGENDNEDGSAFHIGRANHALDLTVCCRSNDLVWGAHGANAVHFSFLHEYLASAVGSQLGTLRQFSNNYHAYTAELDRLAGRPGYMTRTDLSLPEPVSMGSAVDVDLDLSTLWEVLPRLHAEGDVAVHPGVGEGCRTAFGRTVLAAAVVHCYHRAGNRAMALHVAGHIPMPDWRAACEEWLVRRVPA